jgi:hypothetical protein
VPTGTLDSDTTVYLNDGGLVDTTGIVTLLQKKVPRILAFYNNNEPLSTLNSTFADLFGVEVSTDTMNSLEGASLAQVFNESLFDGVIGNLTDGSVLRARLDNVQVQANSYLGVESYELEELIIFSNECVRAKKNWSCPFESERKITSGSGRPTTDASKRRVSPPAPAPEQPPSFALAPEERPSVALASLALAREHPPPLALASLALALAPEEPPSLALASLASPLTRAQVLGRLRERLRGRGHREEP